MAEAARTGGVVTTSTRSTCGFSEPAIRKAKRSGLLTPWGRGVYIVGPVADDETEARAAMLAIPHGTLSFAIAAQLAQFGPIATPPLDVIVAPDRHRERKGLQIHRIELTAKDIRRFAGLPCTTPAVTLVHLARTLGPVPNERAVQEAFAKRLTNTKHLAQGLTTRRYTALQAIDEPALVIAGIAAVLALQKR